MVAPALLPVSIYKSELTNTPRKAIKRAAPDGLVYVSITSHLGIASFNELLVRILDHLAAS